MTSESEVQEQIVALLHSLPSDSSRRRVGLWLRDAALPDLLSAAPPGPGTTDHDGVLVGRELLSSISGRDEVVQQVTVINFNLAHIRDLPMCEKNVRLLHSAAPAPGRSHIFLTHRQISPSQENKD